GHGADSRLSRRRRLLCPLQLHPLPRRDHNADALRQRGRRSVSAGRGAGRSEGGGVAVGRISHHGLRRAHRLHRRHGAVAVRLLGGGVGHRMAGGTGAMTARRDLILRIGAAIWGFAIAISLLPFWLGPPPPGQLPGFATSMGLDARAPLRFVLGLILIPLLWTFALRPILNILARDDTRAWARNAFTSSPIGILWFVIITRSVAWVLIAPAIVLTVSLAMRKVDARFTRHDLILLPVLATMYLALLDLLPQAVEQVLLLSALAVFLVRIAIVPIRRETGLPPGPCFALAPLGLLLQSSFNSYDIRHSPWAPLALVVISPLLLRALIRDSAAMRARFRAALRYVIYPLAVYAYLSATSQLAAEGM